MILEWIRFICGALFLIVGIGAVALSVAGTYRFHYVMNRMHIAAVGDTLGLMCTLAGLMIFAGLHVMAAKMLLIIAFFWLASPVTGHMMAEIEIVTNVSSKKEFEVTKP